uniref:FAD-binding domain-containing protein n=1 Tax=Aegilops tauschii subsp. strangulata TaxID=200361 RepID=A0A453ISK5_AEGTS
SNPLVAFSASTGEAAAKLSLKMQGKSGPHEIRCVKRNFLLETLENELPEGTIRYSSKIVAIEEEGNVKLLHMADGSTISSCGVRRSELGGGEVAGPAQADPLGAVRHQGPRRVPGGDAEESVDKMRQHVLARLRVVSSPLRFRSPLALVRGSICRGGVCVAGDAFHPMTPELGQGGCAALEDGVVLARCLGEALGAGGHGSAEAALAKYAGERRWRAVRLVTAAYFVGFVQQSSNPAIKFLREKFLSGLLARVMVDMADYDCGKL